MEVLEIPIEKLIPDATNARKRTQENIDLIKYSLTNFGQRIPIVIDGQNNILKGNGTYQVAKSLGWNTIKAVRSDLDEHKNRAFALVDNRSSEKAEWDLENLKLNLQSLNDIGISIEELGFDEFKFLIEDVQFTPGDESDQSKLDELTYFECPHCGKEFEKSQAKSRKA